MTTCVIPSCFSQSHKPSSSEMVVPKRRLTTRGSPSNRPIITQTDRNIFPTSIPAHRSTAALIIVVLLSGRRTADIFRDIFFLGSTAPFGDPTCQPGQFRSRLQRLHYPNRPPSPACPQSRIFSLPGTSGARSWAVSLVYFMSIGTSGAQVDGDCCPPSLPRCSCCNTQFFICL